MAVFHARSGAVFAQDIEVPVKITIGEDLPAPNPERFAVPSSAAICNSTVLLDTQEGEAIVRKVANEEHFDLDLALAIARQESGFRMSSISNAGAIGLMQLMPDTAKRFDVDICNPEDNVRGGIRYLQLLQKKYQNLLYVLAAYNAGESAVEQNRGVPLYPETVRYVSAILTDLYGWQPLAQSTTKNQAKNLKGEQQNPDGNPETWTQGFVLHVE